MDNHVGLIVVHPHETHRGFSPPFGLAVLVAIRAESVEGISELPKGS